MCGGAQLKGGRYRCRHHLCYHTHRYPHHRHHDHHHHYQSIGWRRRCGVVVVDVVVVCAVPWQGKKGFWRMGRWRWRRCCTSRRGGWRTTTPSRSTCRKPSAVSAAPSASTSCPSSPTSCPASSPSSPTSQRRCRWMGRTTTMR